MMKGYDKPEAISFIASGIEPREHPDFRDSIPEWIGRMIDADMAYMHENGVIDEEGYAGDAYYEDDEALEYILDRLIEKYEPDPDKAVRLAALICDYMDMQQEYMAYKGLINNE